MSKKRDFAICPLCNGAYKVGWKEPDGPIVCYACGSSRDYKRQLADAPTPPQPWYVRFWVWVRGVTP